MKDLFCIKCGVELKKWQKKYCSLKCQADHKYSVYIKDWKQGVENGSTGISAHSLSSHVEKYVRSKYKNKCSSCGWNKVHPVTGRIPLEIDHKDGNSENNTESNLVLLCPNCHSLTTNFRNLNKGKGRFWRNKKTLQDTLN